MSSILLDTHAFIWLSEDDPNLPIALREIIDNTDDVFVSIASFWEIAIKLNLGKIILKETFNDIEARFNDTRLILLPISIGDAVQLQKLSINKDHKDPFDRLLIVKAISRSIPIMSIDLKFDWYPVQRVWTLHVIP